MHKALFLDRDGVINHDPGDYTYSLSEFIVLPTVMEALRLAQDAGYLLFIITNQGGIAKGLYTHDTVNEIHTYFLQECARHGVQITAIYYSPHHPECGLSLTRKPGSLMLERAIARYGIDPAASMMIGDRDRDIECAAAVGVRGVLMPTNASLLQILGNEITR